MKVKIFTSMYILVWVCLFEVMLNVPIKSNGQVGTLPPFYGTFTQH